MLCVWVAIGKTLSIKTPGFKIDKFYLLLYQTKKDMIDKSSCTNIGECVKQHGTKGELVIRLNPKLSIETIDTDFLFFELDGGLVPFKIDTIRTKNSDDLLVSFFDTENENTLKRLISSQVFAKNADLQFDVSNKDDLTSFIDWVAKDKNSRELGKIVDVIEITNNPLFVIDKQGSELLIPANDDLVSDIDEENRIITLSLPEGLLDMN